MPLGRPLTSLVLSDEERVSLEGCSQGLSPRVR